MIDSFRDFEHSGWSKGAVCIDYHKHFGAITIQSVPAMFDLIYAAVQSHGTMDIGLPSGPNFFMFSDTSESERRLTAFGFEGIEFQTVAQTWRLSSVDNLFEAIDNGTVRAAATLRGQKKDALGQIKAAVKSNLVEYRTGDGYEIPMPAIVASAVRP